MRIFFDIDDTLLDHQSSERAGAKAFYHKHSNTFRNLSQEDFYLLWHDVTEKHFTRFLRGEIDFQRQRQERIFEVFSTVGIKLSDDEADLTYRDYQQEYVQNWRLFDDVLLCLENLRKRHDLGIISNGDLKQQSYKLERMGIRDYFDIVVTASDVGVPKPEQRIFEVACERCQVSPDQTYYIGDDLRSDVLACREAGMKGIWINRLGLVNDHADIIAVASLKALEFYDFI